MKAKECTICKKEYPETREYFYYRSGKYINQCIQCLKEYQREYRERTKANRKAKKKSKKSYSSEIEELKRLKNREHGLIRNKKYILTSAPVCGGSREVFKGTFIGETKSFVVFQAKHYKETFLINDITNGFFEVKEVKR